MKIQKANWTLEGNNVRLNMPITKIDAENRLVIGWATLDNVDSEDDRVTAAASEAAFSRFRGNVREMHQPIAAGRLIEYHSDLYFDPETEKFYSGIMVTVYVSLGAQSTWEKVLDGTLSGFSIRGPINNAYSEFDKDLGRTVRVVLDYDLVELSLVDNPGNPLANLLSIVKSDTGVVLKGIATESVTENVLWCATDELAMVSVDTTANCPSGHEMRRIGWIERGDGDRTENVSAVIAKYRSVETNIAEQANEPAKTEGGVEMAEKQDETTGAEAVVEVVEEDAVEDAVVEVAEESAEEAEATESDAADEAVEKAATAPEVEADKPDLAKSIDDLEAKIAAGIEAGLIKSVATTEKRLADAEAALTKAASVLENMVGELNNRHADLVEKFSSLASSLDAVEKRLDASLDVVEKRLDVVEGETAMKKSGDLGGSPAETLTKRQGGKWNGRFLDVSDL